MSRLDLVAVTHRYPAAAAPAVDGVTLEVPEGARLALVGPSGSGKTTLLRLIAGLERPDAGDIRIGGDSVLAVPAGPRRGVVLAFQDHLLFPHMTVAGNAGFALAMRGLPAGEVARRTGEMLARVRLEGLAGRKPGELSGGQRARVALARALLAGPRILLLDEPLASLDAHLRGEMRDLVAELQRETGVTMILATHDQEEAAALGERIALIVAGRLVQAGPAADFYRRPADAAVARFFGGRNFLPGRSEGGVFDGPLGRLALPAGARAGRGILTIRPEDVIPGGEGENAVEATVAEVQFLGPRTLVRLEAGGVSLAASLPPRLAEGMVPGRRMRVTLPRAALWVLPAGD